MGKRTGQWWLGCLVAAAAVLAGAETAPQAPAEASPQAKAAVASFMQGPSVFIENAGQWGAPEIRFALDAQGANVGLTDRGPKFQLFRELPRPEAEPAADPADPMGRDDRAPAPREMHAFALLFDGAAAVAPEGRGLSGRTYNYNVGPAENHRSGVPSFESIWYPSVWPGVDLEVTGRRTGVKYNFHVAPGADWRPVALRYDGVQGLSLRADGALEIRVKDGWEPLVDAAPYIYQTVNGEQRPVAGAFRLVDGQAYGFDITGAYDPALPLVIDPEIAWGTYLGDTGNTEVARGVAVDGGGNVLVAGNTTSAGWVINGYDTVINGGVVGNSDAFVMKLTAGGGHLWSTFVGSAGTDTGRGVAVDGSGNVFVVGETTTGGWMSGGWDLTISGGSDAFVAKLSPYGAFVWSSYLGGSSTENGYGVATDTAGNVVAVGQTNSATTWVSTGWDTTHNGGTDGFVVKLSAAGSHIWSTYIGGAGTDQAWAVDMDSAGNVLVGGPTSSAGWASGGWDTTYDAGNDGFVLKLSAAAGGHVWSTYVGGAGAESLRGIAVDTANNVIAGGLTASAGWVSGGWDTTMEGANDGYAVKLDSAGAHLWSTYLGGTGNDYCYGVAVDGSGNIYAAGQTTAAGWTSGWDDTLAGTNDGYIVKLDAAGAHQWSGLFGGALLENVNGIAVDANGDMYVGGDTTSSAFFQGYDATYGGGGDGFLVKVFAEAVSPSNPGAINVGASSITWTWQDNSGDETGFLVYDDAGAANPVTLRQTTAANATSWMHTNLLQNTLYTFQVSAQFVYGQSGKSDPYQAWTHAGVPMPPVVGSPTGTTLVVAVGAGDSNPAVTEYAIHCATTGQYVQVDGTLGASEVWLAPDVWALITVNGLAQFSSYTFEVKARNGELVETVFGGQTSGSTLDTIPPTGTLSINGGAPLTPVTAVMLDLTYDDGTGSGVADMQFSDDNATWSGWEALAATKAWTLPSGDGPKTVYAQFRDVSGNVTTAEISDAIALDENPPTGTLSVNGGAAVVNSANVTLDVTYDDAGGSGVVSMQFSHDGSTWDTPQAPAATAPWTLEPGDGVKTVYAQFTDGLGRVSAGPIAVGVFLDTAAPTGTLSINGGAAVTAAAVVTLDLTYDDVAGSGVADMQFSDDNAAWSGWEAVGASKAWTLPGADGPKTVWVQFRDMAGNVSTAEISDGILLDTAGPAGTVSIDSGAAHALAPAVTLGLTYDDGTGSGVVSMQFSDDNAVWSGWEAVAATKAWTLPTGDGLKTVYVQFRDAAGLVSTAQISDTITLDENAPTGTVSIGGGAAYTTAPGVTLGLTYADGTGSGVADMQFSDDNATWSGWESVAATKAWTLPTGDGLKTVYVQFRDAAGRVSAAEISDTITLDETAPTGTVSIDGGAAYALATGVTLDLTHDDGTGSGVAEMQFSNDNATWSGWEAVSATKAWTLPAGDGVKTVYVQFRDAAGSVSTVEISDTITLDEDPPFGFIDINGGAPTTQVPAVTLDLMSFDGDGSGVADMQFSDDNAVWSGWEPAGGTKAWTLPAGDGVKAVYAQFRDTVGRVSTVEIVDWITLDENDPTGTITIDGGAAFAASPAVTLGLTWNDGTGAGVVIMELSNDGVTWGPPQAPAATAPWTLTAGDGPKTVYVKFTDFAGRVNAAAISDGITLDGNAPTGTVAIDGGAAYAIAPNVTLDLTYGDGTGSGVVDMQFSNDNAVWSGWEPVAAAKAWTLSAGDGAKTVWVQFRDAAGYVSAGEISDGIQLDTAPPTAVVTILDPTPTQAAVLHYSVAFSKPVAPTFTVDDVSLTGALAGTVAVAGADPAYTVTVTLTGVNPDGLSGIQLGTDVQDTAGNGFVGAVSPDYDVVWWPGFAAPLADVQSYTGTPGPGLDASVAAGAARAADYQWRWDDGTTVQDGPADAVWSLGTLLPSKGGEYWCIVTYGGFTYTTNHATVEVRDRISIITQPLDQTVAAGGSATLTVAATGGYGPLHYQWKKGGAALPGSPDTPTLTIDDFGMGDAGVYGVEVFDNLSDATESDPATLTLGDMVPAAGLAGLAALAGALVLAGRRAARRRK